MRNVTYLRLLKISTSKTPKQMPRRPETPASSMTSLTAASGGSSLGSSPPPGTIQLLFSLEEDTRRICKKKSML
jgi:hypothetical protein